ncbi:MAG: hypothetical protein AAFP77_03040 [Bacteroidota bacterium]
MKYATALFSICLLFTACTSDTPPSTETEDSEKQTTTEDAQPSFTIKPGEGFGTLGGEMVRADLEEAIGKENVSEGEFYIGEGEFAPGLVLYSDTPEEVEVLLDDDGYVILYRVSKKSGKWATSKGIKVGSTLAELAAANGKPFKFTGFDWDYGGTVTNWNGGQFDGRDFLVVLGYNYEGTQMTEEDTQQLLGDQDIMSDLPAAQRYEIAVVEIMQRY